MWLLIPKLCFLVAPDKAKAHSFIGNYRHLISKELWGCLVQKFSLPLSIFAFIVGDSFHMVNGGEKPNPVELFSHSLMNEISCPI